MSYIDCLHFSRNNGVFVKEALWSGKLRDFSAFSQIKNEIINMSQLAETNNQTLTVISHSWGSMLSGSGLRSSRTKANWVSMGSPYFNLTRPSGVVRYANIMAEGDLVSLPSILNLTAKHIGISNSGIYLAIADMHNYWNNPIVASIILGIMNIKDGDQTE